MADIKLLRYTFKEEGVSEWTAWADELKKRSEEVQETLLNEGVTVEACFMSRTENACYYLIEAADIEKAYRISRASQKTIDIQHSSSIDQNLEFKEDLELLFHFKTTE